MKAGLIEEMMNDALDGALDTEDMEEESEAQVEQVLAELALDTRAALPQAKVGGDCLPGPACSETRAALPQAKVGGDCIPGPACSETRTALPRA